MFVVSQGFNLIYTLQKYRYTNKRYHVIGFPNNYISSVLIAIMPYGNICID